ncbi:hypothetical protein JHK87_012565 [Glycine soja]|nr:hypothetical protein JHK87_012565 [Glycine soja]
MKPLLDFGIAFLLLLHSFLASDIPYPKAISDLKDTIVKGFGFTTENDVKITGFNPRDATVGHSVEYQFDLEINHKVIPFKLLEDVKHWDYMDLPIFQAEAPIGFIQKQASADGLPILAPFHDVDVGVLKKVVQWIMPMISRFLIKVFNQNIDFLSIVKFLPIVVVYFDFMRSFRVEFDEYFEDGLISMIEVGMVSCGELRYPSCSVKHGWRYPVVDIFLPMHICLGTLFITFASADDDFKLNGRMSPAQGGYGTYNAYISAATRYAILGAPTLYDHPGPIYGSNHQAPVVVESFLARNQHEQKSRKQKHEVISSSLFARYLDSKRTWIGAVYPNFKEESLWDKYVTAIYWSIVTVTTTGYGDLHKRDVV